MKTVGLLYSLLNEIQEWSRVVRWTHTLFLPDHLKHRDRSGLTLFSASRGQRAPLILRQRANRVGAEHIMGIWHAISFQDRRFLDLC
jgi:hypothetical protein